MAGRKVGEVFVEVRANLSKLKAGMKTAMSIAKGGASVIGRVLGGLASIIKNVLTAAFKVVGAVIKTIYSVVTTLFSSIIKWAKRGVLALSAFVALSVVVGAKFGQSMARVKALTGASATEFKALREEARRLGRATEYSANEAADAMSIFAMAGFKTNDVITAMTPTLDFAAASGLDLASAADIAARVMGGMQLEAKDLEHTMDVLTKAFTSANMDATDLGEAMKFVGAVGKTVGKDVEEIVGTLTALASAGNRGAMAGTGLRKVLMGLATSKIQKKLAALGVSVTDASGTMKPMSKLIGDLVRATKHLSQMEIADLGVQMFGARGGVAFLQLIGQGEAAIEKYTTQLANVDGFTKKIAATQRDTLATSFKIVQSAIADVMITITDIMEPILRKGADAQVKMWNKIGEVLEKNKTKIQDFITNAIQWIKEKLPQAIHIAIGTLAKLWDSFSDTFHNIKGLLTDIGGQAAETLGSFFEVDKTSGNMFEKMIGSVGVGIIKLKHFFKNFVHDLATMIKIFVLKGNKALLEFGIFKGENSPEVIAAQREIDTLERGLQGRQQREREGGGRANVMEREVDRWLKKWNEKVEDTDIVGDFVGDAEETGKKIADAAVDWVKGKTGMGSVDTSKQEETDRKALAEQRKGWKSELSELETDLERNRGLTEIAGKDDLRAGQIILSKEGKESIAAEGVMPSVEEKAERLEEVLDAYGRMTLRRLELEDQITKDTERLQREHMRSLGFTEANVAATMERMLGTEEEKVEGKPEPPPQKQKQLPEQLAGFSASIQTAIGSATVGVSEQLVYARETAESTARLETSAQTAALARIEANRIAQESADNTGKTADAVEGQVT